MQLVDTLSLLARRWWLVLVLGVAVALIALVVQQLRPVNYIAETTVTVTRVNRAESPDFQYDNFYAAQATEIVVNSSSRLFETGDFALEVAERVGRDVSEAGAIDFARSFKVKQLAPHLLRVRAVDRDEATARAALEAATAELAERVAAMEIAEPREGATAEGQPAFEAVPGTTFSYERTYSQGVVLGAGFVAGLLLGLAVVVLEAAMRSGRTPAKTRS